MVADKIFNAYIPMSETAYYILLSLIEPCHGYGIILKVEEMTKGRMRIGAGTIYGTLTKFEKDQLIEVVNVENRRKVYRITTFGKQVLINEYNRLNELIENGKKEVEGIL